MRLLLLLLPLLIWLPSSGAADTLDSSFQKSVQPFVQRYCLDCHSAADAQGDLDLTADQDAASVAGNFRRWAVVMDRLEAGEMPPPDAGERPSDSEVKKVLHWITELRDSEAKRTSGDPGIVLARRLSNAEYNYTIRDLTGVDIRPAESFPVDPANEAGFDNTGESLTMSPSLIKKYLEAARMVSDHLVLAPGGLEFAPHPVMTFTDRDKYCVNRIIDFYHRQRTDYADYLLALWHFQQADPSRTDGDRKALQEFLSARESGQHDSAQSDGTKPLSARYASTLWQILTGPPRQQGPIAALQHLWRQLPTGDGPEATSQARQQCEQMRDFIVTLRRQLVHNVSNLTTPEVHDGSQPLVLWKNRQFVANRRRYAGGAPDVIEAKLDDLSLPAGSEASAAMKLPDDPAALEQYEQTFEEFCSIFPDKFYVSERARVYLDPEEEKERTGRYLSAGFHNQAGYFRDDAPLYDLMLSDAERRELDRLWTELDFVCRAPQRQYAAFIWFDRTDSSFMRDSQFDRYRAEDKDCTSEAKVQGLKAAYLEKAERVGGNPEALQAIGRYFDDMSQSFRWWEDQWEASQSVHVEAMIDFAQRAFRRPLTQPERDQLRSFYHSLRDQDGLSHDEAIRDCVVATLMSPHFCYRVDLPSRSGDGEQPTEIQPLDDFALASRLSYFLWASMPDDELLDLARAGELHRHDVLEAQTRRMSRDPRARGFVTEFAGNWLDFRRFQEHNGVDRERFQGFTDGLRQSMYEEPIRLMMHVISDQASVLDLLYGDFTFVDEQLARHYGMSDAYAAQVDKVSATNGGWIRMENTGRFGRGGLLPMGVFLTANSPGLRTSPVKRGNWVVKRILGEQIPAPPAAVPELPEDESKLGELTLREALARHRADPSCAACHERIDSFGLVFENYGPVGERRLEDFGGRAVDSHVMFPDDSEGEGLSGLRDYIRRERQDDFVENFCRKLLTYALSRSLQLSDELTIAQMKTTLEKSDHRFSSLVEVIVTSPAFLNQRINVKLER
ncbi:DUF1592 domain-containing protein [Roseiconus nitratireducens]|uniref:DUF1592 domain-containing protein n=1 Tax=Roseiconus nitratireducens TaxID=2605748 RepID=A0A5M6D2Q9_9BACT|nr:DUF1592 domain-containing protein [Roseiconus nitratireducens]KAA5541784.1 DUF1592 domain-containing protein [Roseiconus nitratireducens]